MSTWALIINGVVAEITTIDPTNRCHPDMKWVDTSSIPGVAQRWLYGGTPPVFTPPPAPTPPVLTPAQQSRTTLMNGILITSTSGGWTSTFPVLTDSTGANIWTLLLAEQDALTTSGNTVFADGEATVNWPDIDGVLRVLTPTQFASFKLAIGAFVAKCRNFANGVSGAVLPNNTIAVTIP